MTWLVSQLFKELVELDEHQRIEAKRGSAIGKSIMQTVCAFANEPSLNGGFLLLGVREPDDEHSTYWLEGVNDPDKLLAELQNNCRNQFEQAISIQAKHELIDNKLIIGVLVSELEPVAKPCRFIGKPDKGNKRKTGVWRRGINGDYECTERELEPILLAKAGLTYEQTVFEDATMDDLDKRAIEKYRQLRARVKPHAEELHATDEEMLRALNLVAVNNNELKPNIAGLLLLGKPLALRRLLPAIRVDYVRITGNEWVENPEDRFELTQDFREPLITLLPKLEATIIDDLPRHFKIENSSMQRKDKPLLPNSVIREAVVNALMHRDYHVNQPVLVVRYSNRLEIMNPGYSLKSDFYSGGMGSVLRNPYIAAVLYDLDYAETKGSGIATMRRLLQKAGLNPPVFVSNRQENRFTGGYFFHHFMAEEHLHWLQNFADCNLSEDEAKILILAKELGAVDNAAIRSITSLDTLAASQVLSRLCNQHQLLKKGGSGPATYYCLGDLARFADKAENTMELDSIESDLDGNKSDLVTNESDLDANESDLGANESDFNADSYMSPNLLKALEKLTPKARKKHIWVIILQICAIKPYKAEELASLLKRKSTGLKTKHLSRMREQGLIEYVHKEVINHPEQAYRITPKGELWLKNRNSK